MKIDFNVLQTNSTKTIVFVDESNYAEFPVFPTLQVKFPDVDKVYKCLISPEKLNIITMEKLNAGIGSFPDGIYELKYSIEPHKCNFKFIKYMKVDKILERLKLLYINKVDLKLLNEIYFLITSSQLSVDTNSDASLEFLKTALHLIKKLECNYV